MDGTGRRPQRHRQIRSTLSDTCHGPPTDCRFHRVRKPRQPGDPIWHGWEAAYAGFLFRCDFYNRTSDNSHWRKLFGHRELLTYSRVEMIGQATTASDSNPFE